MFSIMEQLKTEYAGRINFVVRYFPLPGHPYSMMAAIAVEAAAQQDAFEPMYRKMYETQNEWGHTQRSQQPVFVKYARELGVDVDQFVRTMENPVTEARVQRDVDDGTALGVAGTPTIFVNGRVIPSMPSYESLTATIDAVLNSASADSGEGKSATLLIAWLGLDVGRPARETA